MSKHQGRLSSWTRILPIVAGGLAGVISSVGASSLVQPERVAGAAAPSPPAESSSQDRAPAARDGRAASPESSADGQAVVVEPAVEPGAIDMDPEEERAILRQREHDWLAMHAADATDPAWNGQASARLNASLSALAAQGSFQVADVDCRSKSCLATVRWSSYDQAVTSYQELVHARYDMPCTRTILLPEPEDRAAAYQANLTFDCERDPRSTAQ
ncbi:hypothetical protein [Sorangium sp. So ce590]|uniref:hypothetical protein n=1 Tax=unclassified Sorangium TaxID=2621164 RepID=UPI003F5EECF5